MKNVTLLSLMLLIIVGCDSILSENKNNFGHCDEELFQSIREEGSLRLMIRYDMEYEREGLLSEEEALEQRERIAAMHEQLFSKMEELGLEYSGANTLRLSPSVAMSVKEPGLQFLCTSELIESVREVQRLYTQ